MYVEQIVSRQSQILGCLVPKISPAICSWFVRPFITIFRRDSLQTRLKHFVLEFQIFRVKISFRFLKKLVFVFLPRYFHNLSNKELILEPWDTLKLLSKNVTRRTQLSIMFFFEKRDLWCDTQWLQLFALIRSCLWALKVTSCHFLLPP